ncbi:MAG TPA: hypothetical protein VFW29_08420 [Solirubrobacteraceae bacterium]|nr:hypothetical protein [Solirubrobacteraceae bacterium]
MSARYTKLVPMIAVAGTLAFGGGAAAASHGADDPVGHDVGDDHGGLVSVPTRGDDAANHNLGDDRLARPAARHHRHKHHAHARSTERRAHDGANHDAGDDRGRDR